MPINIVYEDPQALGEGAYYAAGRRQRRENIDRSIDRQLQADHANAQLALNYEQLYRNVAQRNLDREAQYVDNVAQREAQAAYQQRAIDADSAAFEARQAGRLEELDRRHELELQRRKFELDEPRRREVEVAERNLHQLEKMIQAEGRDPNEDWVRKARRDLTNLRDGIIFSAPPKEPPPDPLQQAIAQGRAKDLGGGSYLMLQPDGRLERIDTHPNEALEREAEAEREKRMQERYAGIEQTLLKQRDREWEARLKAWERNPVGEPPKHPGFPSKDEVHQVMRHRGLEAGNAGGEVPSVIGGPAAVVPRVTPATAASMPAGAPSASAAVTSSDSEVTVAPETPEHAPSPAAAPPPPPPPIPAPQRVTVKKTEIEAESKNHPPGTTLVDEEGNEYRVYRQAPPNVPYPKSQAEYDALRGGTKYWNPRLGMVVTKKMSPAENRALIDEGVEKVKGGVAFVKRLLDGKKDE